MIFVMITLDFDPVSNPEAVSRAFKAVVRYLAAIVAGLVFLSAALVLRASTPEAPEAQYLSEIDAAMMRMHAGMAVQPTGDIDADFVAMMIPHHQGAIDMARVQPGLKPYEVG